MMPTDSDDTLLHAEQLEFLSAALREVGVPHQIFPEDNLIEWDGTRRNDKAVWRAMKLLDAKEGFNGVGCFDCWNKGIMGSECGHS